MFGRNQPRIHFQPAGLDREIVVPTAEDLAAILHNSQPASLRAVIRCELIQAENRVHDAVDRLVQFFSGHVIEQHDGRVLLSEIIFQGQDLAAVTQRTLREQADLRETV